MNGIPKKLCVAIVGIQAVVTMSDEAEPKWPYVAAVVAICIVFKAVQAWLDKKESNNLKGE